MDPETLLRQAEAALERGADPDEVNNRLRQITEGEFANVEALRLAVDPPEGLVENLRALGGAAKEAVVNAVTNPREHFRPLAEDALAAYEGATLGWGDEILDAVGKAIGREGVGEEARSTLEQMPAKRRIANEILGGILVPYEGVTGLQALRGGKLVTPAKSLLGTVADASVTGTATGAAAGAGYAEPGNRGKGAVGGGLLGLGAGMAGGAVAGAVTQIPRAFRSARRVGEHMADAVRDLSGRGRVPNSALREGERAAQRAARRSLIQPLEEAGTTPTAVTEAFVNGGGSEDVAQTLQRQLRAIRSKNPNARQVLSEIAEVQAGKRTAVETPISFSTADELVRKMTQQARRAERMGAAEEANNLTAAFDLIDEQLRTLPGYDEFKAEWARTSANMRALSEGWKAAPTTKTADEVVEMLNAQPTEEAREMFLESWANRLNARLERRQGKRADVLNILEAGPEFQKKLRQLFPDEQAWQEFQRVAEVEAASISLAQRIKVVSQAIGFLLGGTSLFGRLITSG